MKIKDKKGKRNQRRRRVTTKGEGTAKCPRLVVFRSLRVIYVQAVDDTSGSILACFDSRKIKEKGFSVKKAFAVGEEVAKIIHEKGIEKIVFDRNGYKYHGKVKAIAEGARKSGLEF